MNSPKEALEYLIESVHLSLASRQMIEAATPVAELHGQLESILRPILAEITTNPGLVAYFDLRLIKRAEVALKELRALK